MQIKISELKQILESELKEKKELYNKGKLSKKELVTCDNAFRSIMFKLIFKEV